MDIRYVKDAPRRLEQFDPELDLPAAQAAHVAEIFRTPIDGAYNWDYRVVDNRIKRLYELGKELNWNGAKDVE